MGRVGLSALMIPWLTCALLLQAGPNGRGQPAGNPIWGGRSGAQEPGGTILPGGSMEQENSWAFGSHALDVADVVPPGPVELFLAFASRQLAIKVMECEMPGVMFAVKGKPLSESVPFAGSFQPGSFYIRALSSISSGRAVSVVDGPVYRVTADRAWKWDRGVLYRSLTPYENAGDVTSKQVRDQDRLLMQDVLTLGLSGMVADGTLRRSGAEEFRGRRRDGSPARAKGRLDERGRVRRLEFRFDTEPKGVVEIDYQYAEGNRPWWLPAGFELQMEDKYGPFRQAYTIGRCELGVLPVGSEAFEPLMLAAGAKPAKEVVSSNEANWVVESGRWTPILSLDTIRSREGRSPRGRNVARVVTILVMGAVTLGAVVFALKRGRGGGQE